MADGSFDASALILKSEAGSFSASALVLGERSGSFNASAIVLRTSSVDFSASALVLSKISGSFGISADLERGFFLSSLLLKVQAGSFGISARIREPEYFTPPTVDYENPISVVSVTPTNSTLVYAPSHGFVDGQYVYLDVPGLPPDVYRITYVDVDNFTVAYTVPAYATGGVAYGATPGDKIVIAIDAEDITTDVMYDRTEFVSQANGQAGTCHITILDRDRTQSFTTGQRIYVTVNDLRLWTGYVMRVKRIYPFAANSPAERLIEIEGLDVNILFLKRYAFNPDDPTDLANLGKGPQYPSFTDDTVVLADLFANYLDLTGDDIDTYSLINNLGTINDNQRAAPIKFGETWGETMRRIGNWLSPIWYINPDRQIVWADVDVEDAPFELSDNPGAGQVGVANLAIIHDGTSLINDVLFVSAGYGDTTPVYKRLTDDASVTEHNRSQFGSFITGIYKQGTINRVADSYVNGNPSSRRGHKDDRVQVTCTVFQHGLRVGHKVRVVADAWGFDDIVPIRQLRLRWITPNEPRYDLTITHELDTAWSLFDPYNPKIEAITVAPPPPLKFKDPPGEECDCGITDTFTRTVEGTWGTSDSGITWVYGADGGVSDGVGTLGDGRFDYAELPFASLASWEMTFTASFDVTPAVADSPNIPGRPHGDGLEIFPGFPDPGHGWGMYIEIGRMSSGTYIYYLDETETIDDTASGLSIDLTKPFSVALSCPAAGEDMSIWIWQSSGTKPVTPTLVCPTTTYLKFNLLAFGSYYETYNRVYVDNLDITGVDVCSEYRFDNFNRVVSDGLGTADTGGEWETLWQSFGGTVSANGSSATLLGENVSSDTKCQIPISVGYPLDMLVRFIFNASGGRLILTLANGPHGSYTSWVTVDLVNNAYGTDLLRVDTGIQSVTTISNWLNRYVLLRLQIDTDGFRVRTWLSGSAEPETWDISDTEILEQPTYLSIRGYGPCDINIDSVDFEYDSKLCYEGGLFPVAVDESIGHVCQNFNFVTTTLTLNNEYVTQTVEVWVDGELTTDFTELTTTSIVLGFSPASGTPIRVCYLVQTDSEGGWMDQGAYHGGYIPK